MEEVEAVVEGGIDGGQLLALAVGYLRLIAVAGVALLRVFLLYELLAILVGVALLPLGLKVKGV